MFRHPGATLPQLRPTGWALWRRQWLPTRWEVGVLSSLAILSVLFPVQDALLNQRLYGQAVYRQLTGQIPQNSPPVRLIAIDKKSLDVAQIQRRNPLPWGYLTQVLQQLAPDQPQVIGIDYLLDEPTLQKAGDVVAIREAVRSLVANHRARFVLASILDADHELGVHPDIGIQMPQWATQGYTDAADWFLPLPRAGQTCDRLCPFTYRLAIAQSPRPFQQTFPLTEWSRDWGQFWLQPIFDFSIPPDRIYDRMPAYRLWERPYARQRQLAPPPVILIASDRYAGAGLDDHTPDHSAAPAAVRYWAPRNQPSRATMTGGELSAYAIHHLLTQRLVVPIPDLWMLLLGAIVAKRLTQIKSRRIGYPVLIGTVLYSVVSYQIFISGALLLPIVFPIAAIGLYCLPSLWRK